MEARHVEALQEMLDRLRLEVEELRASRRRLALAADAERRGLERALHDGVQQHLVALAVDVQLAAQRAEVEPSAVKALLDELGRHVRQAVDEAGQLAEQIYPALLESGGLAAALRAAAVRTGVRITLDVRAPAGCPPEVAGTVYWCCVEAVRQARAGAQATVTVREEEGAVAFDVALDGAASAAYDEGLRDRVEALGGVLTIRSEPGRGTRVSGSLPLQG